MGHEDEVENTYVKLNHNYIEDLQKWLESIDDILSVPFLSFTAQTSFDNSVAVLYLSLLNDLLWFP